MTCYEAPRVAKALVALVELVALVTGVVRGRKPFYLDGVYWAFCCHRSHKHGLRCWRWSVYDGYCVRHVETCDRGCTTHGT